jgi:hypothetical protein
MKIEQIQQSIPQSVNVAVIGGLPLAAWLELVNPILQAIAFLVAIAWGGFQIWIAYKKKSWRR